VNHLPGKYRAQLLIFDLIPPIGLHRAADSSTGRCNASV
jgi:hypothetical protein